MKIVPIEVDSEKIYEHRHLYTDDVKYNSLIVSNIFNLNINLINIEDYDVLEYDHKKQIYDTNRPYCNYILSKHGAYIQSSCPYDLVSYSWRFLYKRYNKLLTDVDNFNIITKL